MILFVHFSRLRIFYYNGFEEVETNVVFVRYILKETRFLNKVTMKVFATHSKERLLQKLSMVPRMCITLTALQEKRHNIISIIAKKKKKKRCNIYTIASLSCFLL